MEKIIQVCRCREELTRLVLYRCEVLGYRMSRLGISDLNRRDVFATVREAEVSRRYIPGMLMFFSRETFLLSKYYKTLIPFNIILWLQQFYCKVPTNLWRHHRTPLRWTFVTTLLMFKMMTTGGLLHFGKLRATGLWTVVRAGADLRYISIKWLLNQMIFFEHPEKN